MKITLEESLGFVRWLEMQLVPQKAHCALAGSVLHRGWSEKDLDVIVYSHSERTPRTADELLAMLEAMFPGARLITDTNYPHDRLILRIDEWGEGKWRIELFVFCQPA